MYRVYHSNDLSALVEEYSSLFTPDSLFGDKVVTIVQNKNISSWLKLKLTEIDGINLGLNIEYPENGVRLFIQGYDCGQELADKSLLFMDSLKIVVYKTLESVLRDGKRFPTLYEYVSGSYTKLFQLADTIAGQFFHYGMNCPGLVESWDKGELYTVGDDAPKRVYDQKWQMELWNEIFRDDSPYTHISRVLGSIISSGEEYNPDLSPVGKCRVILFGSSFLGESAIKFFNYLSRDIDVHHFILTPSKIYCDTIEEPKSLLRKYSGLIEGFTTISREDGFVKNSNIIYKESSKDTLLASLQKKLWHNSLSELPLTTSQAIKDSSLVISMVANEWREVEVLKDKILGLLDRDKSLSLTNIGVIAPDINTYAPFVEAIFSDSYKNEIGETLYSNRDLPYNIMGLKGEDSSPFLKGVSSLLGLVGDDFNRKTLLELISNRCYMEALGITPSILEIFKEFISNLNIKWGVDGDHRENLGYKKESFNTWEEGFDRFLMGIALDKDNHESIPYTVEDSQSVQYIGRLIGSVRSLYCDLYNLGEYRLNINEWVFLIEAIIEKYLKPLKGSDDERDRIDVKNQFRNILNLYDDLDNLTLFDNKTLPYQVFKSLLTEFISKSGGNRGRYLTQGVTFSSLKPLRAVPFRHIFVLGLNEDIFPGREKVPGFDLRGIYNQKIDLSKRQNDKYAFLEILLSAKDSVNLFYTSKNIVTGEALQPSIVISELLEAVNSNWGEGSVKIEEHPLQNFSSEYFKKGSLLENYSRDSYDSALIYRDLKTPFKGVELKDNPPLDNLEISVKELIDFVKNPVKFYYTKGESIYFQESVDISGDIFENMELDQLYLWKFGSLVLEAPYEDLDSIIDSFLEIARREGFFKDSLLTVQKRDELYTKIKGIKENFATLDLEEKGFKRSPRELGGEYSPLKFKIDGVDITITGELDSLWSNDREVVISSLTLGGKKKLSIRDKIQSYIYSLILFNSDEMGEEILHGYCFGENSIEPVDYKKTGDYRKRLEDLLSMVIKNYREPIPFLPQIAEKITEDSSIEEYRDVWDDLVSESSMVFGVKDCPYIAFTYDKTPDFKIEDQEEFYSSIYKELKGE